MPEVSIGPINGAEVLADRLPELSTSLASYFAPSFLAGVTECCFCEAPARSCLFRGKTCSTSSQKA